MSILEILDIASSSIFFLMFLMDVTIGLTPESVQLTAASFFFWSTFCFSIAEAMILVIVLMCGMIGEGKSYSCSSLSRVH